MRLPNRVGLALLTLSLLPAVAVSAAESGSDPAASVKCQPSRVRDHLQITERLNDSAVKVISLDNAEIYLSIYEQLAKYDKAESCLPYKCYMAISYAGYVRRLLASNVAIEHRENGAIYDRLLGYLDECGEVMASSPEPLTDARTTLRQIRQVFQDEQRALQEQRQLQRQAERKNQQALRREQSHAAFAVSASTGALGLLMLATGLYLQLTEGTTRLTGEFCPLGNGLEVQCVATQHSPAGARGGLITLGAVGGAVALGTGIYGLTLRFGGRSSRPPAVGAEKQRGSSSEVEHANR